MQCHVYFSLLSLTLLTGCMVIGHNDQFEFVRDASHETGSFVPQHYIAKQKQNVYLPFFWIYNEQPPHDLAVLTFDQTYQRSSEPFETIVIESLQIERAGEPPVDLVSPTEPLESRTHKVAKGKDVFRDAATIIFKAAITRRDSFTVLLRGYAVDKQGQRHPFDQRDVHQFNERKWSWGPLTA